MASLGRNKRAGVAPPRLCESHSGMVIRANGKLPAADKNLGLAAARWRGNAASLCDMTRAALLVFSAAVVGVNCFGYLPDPEVLELYPDVGGCASSLEERMFDGEYSQSESSAEQCWTMCTAAYPETTSVNYHCGGNDDDPDGCWCYCQSGCVCLFEMWQGSVAAPVGTFADAWPASCCEGDGGARYTGEVCEYDDTGAVVTTYYYSYCTEMGNVDTCVSISTEVEGEYDMCVEDPAYGVDDYAPGQYLMRTCAFDGSSTATTWYSDSTCTQQVGDVDGGGYTWYDECTAD